MNELLDVTRLKVFVVCCLITITGTKSLYAQKGNVVILDHADSLVGLVINGEQARELIGNVKFRQGNVVVTCKRAVQYLTSNKIALEGEPEMYDGKMRMVGIRGMYYGDTKTAEVFDRVMLEESTTTLKAQYGKYFADEKKAFFTTNVSVEDTGSVLTADTLTYYREIQHSIADGHVIITTPKKGMIIYGDHFENFKQQQFSKVTGHPKVVQVDTTGENKRDTLVVRSTFMEAYQDSLERLVARDSVTVTRGSLAAEAGRVVFYTVLDSMVLRRSPYVWYGQGKGDENQLSGDSIFIKLNKRKLRRVDVRGSALAISTADSLFGNRFNQMSGQEIMMEFQENKIQQIDVDKTATSLYYLFEEGKGNGMNKTTGDHVTITFLDGKIDKLKVLSGVEGAYYPEKLIKNKEIDYNLRGFNWREHHPGKKK
jgi:lipopolysaccharide export system protein LptA